MEDGNEIRFRLLHGDAAEWADVRVRHLVIAGWTGRDRAAMEEHIRELEALGVPRPTATPTFYRVSGSRLTTSGCIQVCGPHSSGEVEFIIVRLNGGVWIGAGSDHTDRELEKHGVALSKQICDKPVAAALWPLDDLRHRWDSLELRAFAVDGNGRHLYQQGSVAAMREPGDLLARYRLETGHELEDGGVMFCGTLPALGGVRGAARFEFELSDPAAGRRISHGYDVVELPVAG